MTQTHIKDLTKGKIFKQLIQLALPIIATNFIQMAYTLTDIAWLGRIGSKEVAAIGAVGILTWLTTSLALLTKIAAEITIAQAIGSKQLHKARNYASHTTTISLIIGIIITLLLLSTAPYIISLFHLQTNIATIAVNYLQIVALGIPFFYLSYTFSGIYNGTGRTTIPFYIMSAGLACNMILDPIMIFGINGTQAMGTQGAALATVISQTIVFLLFIWHMKQPNSILNRFHYIVRLKKDHVARIFQLGTPTALMTCFFAAISFAIARIASEYGGHLGIMSQATGSQIEGITWNTTQGFSVALATFVAQNYTAGKIKRTHKAYQYTLLSLLSLGILITFIFIFFGKQIFSLFVPETEAILAGANYLFIMAFCQIFMMIENTTLGMWNGYGQTLPPAIVSITLNLARIPLALWLAPSLGINGVWIAITISAILKGIISFTWWKTTYKQHYSNHK